MHVVPPLIEWARAYPPKEKGGFVLIAPRLYLGNKEAAADSERLSNKGVVGVCAVGARQVFRGAGHHVSIEDDGTASMLPFFETACNFIHEQRQMGAVLVHCKGGISRSPTMIIAYLMRHEHLCLTDAIEVCCLARPAARPRATFLADLESYEFQLVQARCWHRAVELASEDAVAALTPRDPGSRAEVQAECKRLLAALQEQCMQEAFGELREPSWQLRDAAQTAVTSYADSHGWRKRTS